MEQQQKGQGQQMTQQQKMQKQEEDRARQQEIRESLLKQFLDNDARDRLSRIRLVKPEKAQQLETYIIKMGQSGQLQESITEFQLVGMLEKFGGDSAQGPKITIQRKRADSDDW